ncbi:MAG TPA: SH3 domain-containing protein, partial [Aggregatilinea sp.]|uniref:SH3 domain-containing protein n=1 Tax=Aggregatilinea sp. TaxID=2806333 RepID=UPI002C866101
QPLAVNINWNPIPDVVITPPPGSASATQTLTSSSGSGSGGGSCTLAFDGPVNVRSGPSTTTGIIGGVSAGDTLPVTGRSADGKWWQVNYNGQTGWVSAGLLQIDPQGACDAVPTAGTPAPGQTYTPQYTYTPTVTGTPPTATYTYTPPPYTYTPTYTPPAVTYTPTYTPPADQVAPTYTYTPSYTPTFQQPTHTYTPSYTPTTPPAAQIAPPDSNYAFNVALDTTGSFTEFVSYPGGDTQDRVGYTVTGMNPNVAFSGGRARLVIAASCFGNGLEYVQFFTAGNTFGCGQTILDTEITYEQRTGLVTINAVGGEGTYVQWVVTISVTRIN